VNSALEPWGCWGGAAASGPAACQKSARRGLLCALLALPAAAALPALLLTKLLMWLGDGGIGVSGRGGALLRGALGRLRDPGRGMRVGGRLRCEALSWSRHGAQASECDFRRQIARALFFFQRAPRVNLNADSTLQLLPHLQLKLPAARRLPLIGPLQPTCRRNVELAPRRAELPRCETCKSPARCKGGAGARALNPSLARRSRAAIWGELLPRGPPAGRRGRSPSFALRSSLVDKGY
jgi:hypothetical protein